METAQHAPQRADACQCGMLLRLAGETEPWGAALWGVRWWAAHKIHKSAHLMVDQHLQRLVAHSGLVAVEALGACPARKRKNRLGWAEV